MEVITKLVEILGEKILEKVSKGKELKFNELSAFFLSQIYIETHKISTVLNNLAEILENLRKDIKNTVSKPKQRKLV